MGNYALVDDEDFEWLNQWKWYARKHRHTYYAQRTSGKIKGKKNRDAIQMHRVIMGIEDGAIHIDHRDHHGLNNQKFNLRTATSSQNAMNRSIQAGKTRGVVWRKRDKVYYAVIKINQKSQHIGTFRDKYSAMLAYNNKAIELFGEFATLNVIPDSHPGFDSQMGDLEKEIDQALED